MQKKETFTLKHLKSYIRWIVGIVGVLVICVYLFLSLPFTQRWLAGKASAILSELLQARVQVSRVQIGFLGRVIVDDLHLWDRQEEPLLSVTRTAAQIDVGELLTSRHIVLNSAQLFGAEARIYREHPDSAYNFQFVLDAFASKDTTRKPLPHVEVHTILVRHTKVSLDHRWMERQEGRFDPHHLSFSGLSIKASLNLLTDDSLDVELDRLAFEEQSGLSLTEASGRLRRGKASGWQLSTLRVGMPGSLIETPHLNYHDGRAGGRLSAQLSPRDFASFFPPLSRMDDVLHVGFQGDMDTQDARLSVLEVWDSEEAFHLVAKGRVKDYRDSTRSVEADIEKLLITNELARVVEPLVAALDSLAPQRGLARKIPTRLIGKLGRTEMTGHLAMEHLTKGHESVEGDLHMESPLGEIQAKGHYREGRLKAQVSTRQLQAGEILGAFRDSVNALGSITAELKAEGRLQGEGRLPEGNASVEVKELHFKDYAYHDIHATLNRKGSHVTALVRSADPSALMNAEFRLNTSRTAPLALGLIHIENLDLQATHLLRSSKIHRLSAKVGIDFEGNTPDNMRGTLSIPHVITYRGDTAYSITHIQFFSEPQGEERHLRLTSPYLTLHADGRFNPLSLGRYMQQMAHNWMPDLFKAPTRQPDFTQATFHASISDLSPLEELTGKGIAFRKGPLTLDATLDSEQQLCHVVAQTPAIAWGNMELHDFRLNLHDVPDNMQSKIQFNTQVKDAPLDVNFRIQTLDNQLDTRLEWNHRRSVRNLGALHLRGTIERQSASGLGVRADMLPTELYINDTLWHIAPAHLDFHDKKLQVEGFRFSMAHSDRSLSLNGTASKQEEDSLFVDLKDIDLDYIFTLAKIKPIHLGGYATGRIVGTRLFQQPVASGQVRVPNFLFNGAPMGDLNAKLGWGQTPGTLTLNARVDDAPKSSHIDVKGFLHLLKDPLQHMDLNVEFAWANAAFMQRYVGGIMDDFTGRVSGQLHIYGIFGSIEMQGEALAHEVGLTIPSLNTRYTAFNERLTLRPDGVTLQNVTGHDSEWQQGQAEHSAVINGRITYDHFRDMHYHFDIDGTHIMAYNTRQFGDMPFYATAYGTGKVNLDGGPGYVNINIDATPTRGTTLTYNASSPETLTEAGFLTFVDRSRQLEEALDGKEKEVDEVPTSDMRINFNLNLTPEAQLRLLMDPRTDDYITLYGSSHLKCTYYNKGSFKMYGTYHLDRGTYKLTLQDVIHKQFRQGGTIVFGGNPFDASLDLQAVYTVPSVSLNDLSARSTFSNTNVRVNCLMNLGGKAGAPRVTFDFDIPNVNEDELRMVRSLISTDEERNLQVIYLLGIGRFYTYDYTGNQSQQSTAAMNSLLSTTLSGQLNQIINTITGSSNWNFGANLSTGNTGWSDLDVEGMLSGRLLNNRLLINGSFGYRDNPVATSNFIGDFDVQWLLNKHGSLILKAYSETNERYFTKSALTTQGIGFMVKKDFTNLGDIFRFLRRKKVQESSQKE